MSLLLSTLASWGVRNTTITALGGFVSPSPDVRPMIRWWWPHGIVELDEIRDEVDQIASAGFGGIEIQDVHHSITDTIDHSPDHGWAGTTWKDAIIAAFETANNLGLKADMGMGPCWPLGVPSINPDDAAAAKEIVLGKTFITNHTTYNGSVPSPYMKPAVNVTRQSLYTLQAWRVNKNSNTSTTPIILDYDSVIDLTGQIVDNKISWTPPDSATWLLLSAVVRGTGQVPEDSPHTDPPTYVIDHFSTLGVDAVVDFWENNILSDEFRSLLKTSGGAFMEDSLEMTSVTYWTPNFPVEFEKRRGYKVPTILPVILQQNGKNIFSFADSNVTYGARNDYYDTLSDLYIDLHIQPLKKWATSLGMKYCIQPYGVPRLDGIRAAAALDIPEGESLGFKAIDNYRALAGAAGMAQLNILSNELGAYAKAAYATTWAKILGTMNPEFATGVNQNVLHGFSYIIAPGSTWPGFAAFTPIKGTVGYSESWGPRQPAWRHAPDITSYIGRMQYLMRLGVPKHDCALFRQNGAVDANYVAPFFTSTGAQEGWSCNYIDPGLFKLSTAFIRDNRFGPEVANYGLMVIQGDPFANAAPLLTIDTAKSLRTYAGSGLPMLFIGDWSSARAFSLGSMPQSSVVKSYVDDILKLENVVNIASANEINSGLESLGVKPAVRHESSPLIHLHRENGELDHYLLVANSSSTGVNQSVSIPCRFENTVPVMLDPWTGNMTILPLYQVTKDNRISIPVLLNPYQTSLITLLAIPNNLVRHALSTTAPILLRDSTGLRLLARSTTADTFVTTLDNGTVYNTTISTVPPAIGLNNWMLTVDDWQPADGNGSTGDVTATKLVRHELNITSLVAWTSITELQDASGNGTYLSTFTLGSEITPWTSDMGAYVQVTKFNGSFRMKVNGHELPPLDQLSLQFDIGSYVKSGENTLEIEIATSLLNRMKVVQPSAYASLSRQSFGLFRLLYSHIDRLISSRYPISR